MPFTHHSHSGQFCPGHARNSLEEVLDTMVQQGMSVIAFTEHIPRDNIHRYPEELSSNITKEDMIKMFDSYVPTARSLQSKHAGSQQFNILVGFEGEWVRPAESTAIIKELMLRHSLDYFIGSVHHVHTIPIDYSRQEYVRARDVSDGTDNGLALSYYQSQYELLSTLKPLLVGHFDLIRLYSDEPDRDWRTTGDDQIWQQICRNLQTVKDYGGILEVNSSGVRKGLKEPYPRREICNEWVRIGGRLTVSDDSHGVDQVGACYHNVKRFLSSLNLTEVAYLSKVGTETQVQTMSWETFDQHRYWKVTAE